MQNNIEDYLNNLVKTNVNIKKEYLYNINLEDEFFSSLKADYKDYEKWFKTKQKEGKQAYISKNKEGQITSFLMLKQENENENYSFFEKPFNPNKRLKISTFKVLDTGKNIGDFFVKLAIKEAMSRNIDEIYITTFEKQKALILLLEHYGFKFYTYKNTELNNNKIKKEAIYVKSLKQGE